MEKYTKESDSLVNFWYCCAEVQSGLITHDALGSIPKRSIARMAELVDACDLKSYLSGCWFDSSYEQIYLLLFLRKVRLFNKSRYARNRQLARVIFYFSLYINIAVIYWIVYVFYGLSFYHGWLWWLIFIVYLSSVVGIFFRTTYLKNLLIECLHIFTVEYFIVF